MQNIIIDGKPRVHKITLNKEELFNLTSLESVYYTERSESPNDLNSVMDDDRQIFEQNLKMAIADLTGLLARRIDTDMVILDQDGKEVENNGIVNTQTTLEYYLIVGNNHDNNILTTLSDYCSDYLVKKVLEKWYRIDFGSDATRLKIINAIYYRKRPVNRKIRNFL